jgi:NADH dehydrogenase/NADH:ubiquinone oxidoreductase subunit G
LHINIFLQLLESKSLRISKLLIKDSSPIFFLGSSLSKRGLNIKSIQSHLKSVSPTAVIFNLKAFSNSSANAYLNINSFSKKTIIKSDFLFLINLNESFNLYKYILSCKKNIFMLNTHGFSSFKKCDTLIPILDTFEENNIYINLEERPQTSLKIISNPGNARSLKSFLELLIQSNLVLTNAHNFLFEIVKTPKLFSLLDFSFSLGIKNNLPFNFISTYPVKLAFEDFYRSNKHTKISSILMESSYDVRKSFRNFF